MNRAEAEHDEISTAPRSPTEMLLQALEFANRERRRITARMEFCARGLGYTEESGPLLEAAIDADMAEKTAAVRAAIDKAGDEE